MAQCRHYDICERESRTGDKECILHSEDSGKEISDFMAALMEHYDAHGPNFERVWFPQDASLPTSEYEQRANFRRATFNGAGFQDVNFRGGADFSLATFQRGRYLRTPSVPAGGTAFATSTVFSGVTFRGGTRFMEATFEEAVSLRDTTFEGEADFTDATFKDRASFTGTTFEESTFFVRTVFEKEAHFMHATFEDDVSFSQTAFGVEDVQISGFGFRIGGNFEGDVNFSGSIFQKKTIIEDISPERIDFRNCRVRDSLMLTGSNNRIFNGSEVVLTDVDLHPDSSFQLRNADLTQCRIRDTNVQEIDFTGVKWCEEVSRNELFSRAGLYEEVVREKENSGEQQGQWTEIERLYRGLKKNYEEKGDYPRAGDFHIGEKEMRRRNPETQWGVPACS